MFGDANQLISTNKVNGILKPLLKTCNLQDLRRQTIEFHFKLPIVYILVLFQFTICL